MQLKDVALYQKFEYEGNLFIKVPEVSDPTGFEWNALSLSRKDNAPIDDVNEIIWHIGEELEVRPLSEMLRKLIEAADSGEWHYSIDCKAEDRQDDCLLCQAITEARRALTSEAKR